MSKTQRWLVLATVSAGLLMVSVDTTVLYTALPTLTSDLQADASQKLWIIKAYDVQPSPPQEVPASRSAPFGGWTRKPGPAPSVAGSQAGELGNRLGRGAFMAENDLLASGFEPDPPRG
jgi:hypothetical protein